MYIPRPPHNWKVTKKQAILIQKKFSKKVSKVSNNKTFKLVAGVDAAFSRNGQYCIAGVVLWDIKKKKIIEHHTASKNLIFPYIPGLLTFREGSAVIAALRKLNMKPDLLICDGQGIAHQRRFGIASHVGIITGIPSIGCGKSRLIGEYKEPSLKKGKGSPLYFGSEELGTVLRTKDYVKPVFVSIGHKMDLRSAEKLILQCCTKYRLPEPVRLADRLVATAKKKFHC